MITLLHGENQVESRKELDRIKSEFKGEIINLEGKTLTETDLVQATQSQSLFGGKKLVVIEGMPKFDLTEASCDVVVWEGKTIGKIGEIWKTGEIKEFKISPTIWKFLNSMTVPNFRAALKDNDVQFLFIMMARQFKGNKEKLGKLLKLDYQNKQGLLATNFPTAIELFLLGL